jgi:hypothetical protein
MSVFHWGVLGLVALVASTLAEEKKKLAKLGKPIKRAE